MMIGFTGILLQSYLFFLYGCSSQPRVSDSKGQVLYSAKCTSCHRLLPPQDYTADVWRQYVAKYGKQATEDEQQQILDYLQKNAAPGPSGGGSPKP